MNIKKVNIKEKLTKFNDHWNPRIIGELNGQYIKAAKLKGDFIAHKHEYEDEMFLVIKGCLKIELKNEIIEVNEGEFVIIPKGQTHKPIADEEVEILLFEPKSTINTGNQENKLTRTDLEDI